MSKKKLSYKQEKVLRRWLLLFGKKENRPTNFTYIENGSVWKLRTFWKGYECELQMPYRPLGQLENCQNYTLKYLSEDLFNELLGGEK